MDKDLIIKELFNKYGIKVNDNDPIIQVVYLNKIILESYVLDITSTINQSIENIAINEERVSRKLAKLLSDGNTTNNATIKNTLLRHIDDMNAVLARTHSQPASKVSSNTLLWLVISFLLGLILGGVFTHYLSH